MTSVMRPAPYNPRKMSPEAAKALAVSMKEFGDLSGLVVNVRTGNIVTGHQRRSQLPGDFTPEQTEQASDSVGTVGYGYGMAHGTRWPVRFVDWPEAKEKAANVAANSPLLQGEFSEALSPLLRDVAGSLPDLTRTLRLNELLPRAETAEGKVKPVELRTPISRVWVLLGIPASEYDKHADALAAIGRGEEVFFDTTIR